MLKDIRKNNLGREWGLIASNEPYLDSWCWNKMILKLSRPAWGVTPYKGKVKILNKTVKREIYFVRVHRKRIPLLRDKLIELGLEFQQDFVLYVNEKGAMELISLKKPVQSVDKDSFVDDIDNIPFTLLKPIRGEFTPNVLTMCGVLSALKNMD